MKYFVAGLFVFIYSHALAQRNSHLRSDFNIPPEIRDQTNDPRSEFPQSNSLPVREGTVFYIKEMLRSVDLSIAPNNELLHIKTAKDTNQTITSILLQALIDGNIQAFATAHDSVALRQREAITLLNGTDSTTINKYLLLERWQFDTAARKMKVKIIRIAPCRFEKDNTLYYKEIFWIKYLPLEQMFSSCYLSDGRITNFFETREFISKILNVTTVDTVYCKKLSLFDLRH